MMNINETLANYFKDAQQLIKNLIERKKGRLDLLIIELYEVEKATMILTGKRDVDVLTYNSLHPLLKDRILREQEVIL